MEPELDRFGNPYDSSEDELDRFGNPYDSAELPQEFKAPEKQRIRNLLQGATFNTADEAEALATRDKDRKSNTRREVRSYLEELKTK